MAALPDRVWTALRETVHREASRASLRGVARDVGVSASTLHNFLDGARPQPRTARKLTEWYARVSAARGELDPRTSGAVLSLQLDGLAGGVRDTVLQRIVDAILEGHREQGTRAPKWVSALGPADDPDHG